MNDNYDQKKNDLFGDLESLVLFAKLHFDDGDLEYLSERLFSLSESCLAFLYMQDKKKRESLENNEEE